MSSPRRTPPGRPPPGPPPSLAVVDAPVIAVPRAPYGCDPRPPGAIASPPARACAGDRPASASPRASARRVALLARLLAALVALVALPAAAKPPPTPAADALAGQRTRPVPVHFPVALGDPARAPIPAALLRLAPGAAPAVPTTAGPVIVGPRRAALVRVSSLGALRLRARAPDDGVAAAPRLRRLQGEAGGSWLATDEAAHEVAPGTWLLQQPPGGPGYWLVSAERPLEIVVEAVADRSGDLIWEDRAAAILAWIDAGGDPPPLPEVDAAADLRRGLLVDAEIAAALVQRSPDDAPLRIAARAWRRASALARLAVARDLRRAAFGPRAAPHTLEGTAEVRVDARPDHRWRRREGAGRWILELEGPGLLVVDARLIGAGPDGGLTIAREGRHLGAVELLAARRWPLEHDPEDLSKGTGPKRQGEDRAAEEDPGDPGDPRGTGAAGDDGDASEGGPAGSSSAGDQGLAARLGAAIGAPLGPRAELRVALAPGRHRYELRFVGREGALRVRSGVDTPPLAAALRGDTVAAAVRQARRALGRSTSADAPLLADLLDEVAGGPGQHRAGAGERARASARSKDAPGPRRDDPGEVVALTDDLLRARAVDLSAKERRALARRLADAADRSASPTLAWEARAAGLDALADVDAPALVRRLAGSQPEGAPTSALHRLARAIEGPPILSRSPALALLDRVRRQRPLDPGVRAVLREQWRSSTRWAGLHADDGADDPWHWIEPLPADPNRSPSTSSLWTWSIGQVHRVRAGARASAPDHPALLRVYAGALDPAAPLALAVGGRRWHTRALRPLEVLKVALPPGEHEVEVAAPKGARVWSSMAPAPGRPADARLLRMWPLRRGASVGFAVPGGDLPGYVRVELRGLAPDLPATVRLRVTADVGPAREVDVALVAEASQLLPVDAPAAPSGRAVVVLPVDARARTLAVELVDGAPQVAVAAALRITRGGEEAPRPGPETRRLARLGPTPAASRPASPDLAADDPASGSQSAAASPTRTADSPTRPPAPDSRPRPAAASPDTQTASATSPTRTADSPTRPPDADASDSQTASAASPTRTADSPTRPPAADSRPRPAAAAAPTRPAAASGDEAALVATVAEASAGLLKRPNDRRLRIRRAAALLELDQRSLALVDWDRVVAGGLPAALVADAVALAVRLDDRDAPEFIDLRIDRPTLVSPALAAVVGDDPGRLDPYVPAIEAAWRRGPEAGLKRLAQRLGPTPERTMTDASARTEHPAPAAPPKNLSHGTDQNPTGPSPGAAATHNLTSKKGSDGDTMASRDQKSGSAHTLSKGTGSPTADPRPRGDLIAATLPARRQESDVRVGDARAGDPIADALAATWLGDAGRPREAALRWVQVGGWQAELASIDPFLAALDRPGSGADGAGVAHGVVQDLQPTVRTPALRRLRAVAAARSRWTRVLGSERSGGSERLHVPREGTLPGPSVAVQRALLAAPWPDDASVLLSPGESTVVELRRTSTRAIAVDLWCQPLRPDLGDGAPAQVHLRVDGGEVQGGPVAAAAVETWTSGRLPPGTHRVDVELDPASVAHRCAARIHEAGGEPLVSRRPTRWWVARAPEAVDLVVVGPTTLAIEARAELHEGAGAITLELGPEGGPLRPHGALALPRVVDPGAEPEAARALQPGLEATAVVLVTEPGPHRLRIAADRGVALVRVVERVDGGDAPARPVRGAVELGALVRNVDAVPLPPLPEPTVAPAPAVSRAGTFTADLRVGSDDLDDADDLHSRVGATLRLGYARELLPGRLWIAAHGELRPREATRLTGGGGLAIQGYIPRAGLRLRVDGQALTQAVDEGHAWSLRGGLHVDRPTWIARRLQLLPRLDVLGRLQSLAPGGPDPGVVVHPRVYQSYVADHPFVLLPGLDLRIQPWRDARVIVGVDAAPNSDLRSLDHVDAEAGFYGVLALPSRLVPEFWVEEQLSYRLRDADRSQAFLRSRLRAGAGLGIWASRDVRVVFGAADTLYTSTRFPLRNVVEAWLRVDLVLGRGLRDFGPLGMSFRPVREGRLWYPDRGTP